MVLLAFFQALADAFPKEADRQRILRDTVLTANELIRKDTHNVPIYAVGDPNVVRRPIQEGEQANLWTYLDWMEHRNYKRGFWGNRKFRLRSSRDV